MEKKCEHPRWDYGRFEGIEYEEDELIVPAKCMVCGKELMLYFRLFNLEEKK